MKQTVTILDHRRKIMLYGLPQPASVRHRQLGKGLTLWGDNDILRMPYELHDVEDDRRFADGLAPDEVSIADAPKWLHAGATPAAEVPAPHVLATREINIDDALVGERFRPVLPENAAKLAESLKTLGQQRAITMRPAPGQDGKFVVVAGATLLAAAKLLNSTHIRADIIECDEVEARLWEIAENLYRAELTALEEAEHLAEWIRVMERKVVSRQKVAKPKGGRPEGAITKAARELPLKGKTRQARRKAIERKLKIASITQEARTAAKEAGLDDRLSALREIAKQETAEAQLAKVHEIERRLARNQAKRDRANKKAAAAKANGAMGPAQPTRRHPDEVAFAELKTTCSAEFKRTWAKAHTEVRRRFLREVLKWVGGKPLANSS